ncbi:MAG: branched-chain amino acid ABC transporter permease [Firmicutes bacterium]|nr:branched-chain amino acid ABC transporter permease [Bacillota bacterium]
MGYFESVFVLTGINIIAMLGVALMFGFTGLFTFGHAAFMGIGGYTCALLILRGNVPYYLALAGGVVAAVMCSLVIGYPTLRLKGDYFVVGSMGVGEIVARLIEAWDGLTGGSRGLPGIPFRSTLLLVGIIAVLCIVAVRNLLWSRHGFSFVAILENEMAAQTLGINVFKYKMIVFAISAGLAGLAGGLIGSYTTVLHPSMFGFQKSTELIIGVILGGVKSLTGSILAAFLVTLLPEVLRAVAEWRLVLYGATVIFIIIAKPKGLLGYREISPQSLCGFGRPRSVPGESAAPGAGAGEGGRS